MKRISALNYAKRRDLVRQLLNEGFNVTDVAEILGMTRAGVYHVVKNAK